ncbi:MAG TPA: NUDIX hydrolase [Steroidobacteraceae bacterium]|nr:NUDIX hydrolase [Steroidobacteraceae bacterium]
MTWKPELTVAAVATQRGRFLVVEERVARRRVFNQPAGHVEDGETLIDAVVRETLEETAWHFEPQFVVGIYLWRNPDTARSYLRVAFGGALREHEPGRALDTGIVCTHWFARGQLLAHSSRLRSPLVMRCIDDWLSGARYPLSLLHQVTPEAMQAHAAVV